VDVEDRRLMSGGKILQVVRNVLGRIQSARSFASCHIVSATQIVENFSGPLPPQYFIAGTRQRGTLSNPRASLLTPR
jgi:hypothetical protein